MNSINWSNVSSMGQMFQGANTASGGFFWIGMLQMIFVVAFLVLISWGWEIAILVAAFLGLILSILMSYSHLISWQFVLQFAAIILFMIIYIMWSGRRQ
jgi:hypothetical protein